MRASVSALVAIALATVITTPLAGGEAPPAAVELPNAIGGDVVAVIRVDDIAWVVQQFNSALGGNGDLAATARTGLAEVLFNCRTMGSIDDSRPSLLAWRSGDAPLVAAIPVKDRDRFLNEFGGLRHVDRLLVRTGEREGTVVYNQVTPQGTWEYRLMMRDEYAYLARTKEECELLADSPLRIDTDAPPLRVEWRGDFLAAGSAPDALEAVDAWADPLANGLDSVGGPIVFALLDRWRALLTQISLLQLRLSEGADGEVAIGLACSASSDTPLATWMSRQSNAGSRLLPLVTRPGDVLSLHGTLRWQGELERLGRTLAKELLDTLGRERFTEQMDADLRSYFSLLDRQGAFAMSMGLVEGPDGWNPVVRAISEQPNAADLITLEQALAPLFEAEGATPGEFDTLNGLLAYKRVEEKGGSAVHSMDVAARDHRLTAAAGDAQTALVEARTLIASIGETHPPHGAAGICAIRLNLDAIFKQTVLANGGTAVEIDPLVVDLACRVDEGRRLAMEVSLPLAQIQETVVRIGLLPDPDDRSQTAPGRNKNTGKRKR